MSLVSRISDLSNRIALEFNNLRAEVGLKFPLASPGGSSTDATAAINARIVSANTLGGSIVLGDGNFYISSPLTALSANVTLRGQGNGTRLRLKSTYTGGSPITASGKGVTIREMQVFGGDNTGSCLTNPSIGAFISANTTNFLTVRDIDFYGVNGWCVQSVATSGLFGNQFVNLRGTYNGGGLQLVGNSVSGYGVQNFFVNINMQVFETTHMFDLDSCNDVQILGVNSAVSGTVLGANVFHIKNGSSILLANIDVGSYPALPGNSALVRLEGTPNNVQFLGGILQGGLYAVQIDGGVNIQFRDTQFSRSGSSAIRINAGTEIDIADNLFARNGYTAGSTSEVVVIQSASRVKISRNRFTTPVGTASQQVAYVVKIPVTHLVTFENNEIRGGHTQIEDPAYGVLAPDKTLGTKGDTGAQGLSAPKTEFMPIDHGLLAWSYTPIFAASASQPDAANARLHGTRIWIPGPCTITNVWVNVVTAGVGLTSGSNKAVIYDSSGNLLGTSVDQSTNWLTGGPWGCALVTPVVIPAAGWYDVGFWTAGTTMPAFGRATSNTGMNTGFASTSPRFWKADTGLTSTAPATIGTKAPDATSFWMAVSGTPATGFGAAFGVGFGS